MKPFSHKPKGAPKSPEQITMSNNLEKCDRLMKKIYNYLSNNEKSIAMDPSVLTTILYDITNLEKKLSESRSKGAVTAELTSIETLVSELKTIVKDPTSKVINIQTQIDDIDHLKAPFAQGKNNFSLNTLIECFGILDTTLFSTNLRKQNSKDRLRLIRHSLENTNILLSEGVGKYASNIDVISNDTIFKINPSGIGGITRNTLTPLFEKYKSILSGAIPPAQTAELKNELLNAYAPALNEIFNDSTLILNDEEKELKKTIDTKIKNKSNSETSSRAKELLEDRKAHDIATIARSKAITDRKNNIEAVFSPNNKKYVANLPTKPVSTKPQDFKGLLTFHSNTFSDIEHNKTFRRGLPPMKKSFIGHHLQRNPINNMFSKLNVIKGKNHYIAQSKGKLNELRMNLIRMKDIMNDHLFMIEMRIGRSLFPEEKTSILAGKPELGLPLPTLAEQEANIKRYIQLAPNSLNYEEQKYIYSSNLMNSLKAAKLFKQRTEVYLNNPTVKKLNLKGVQTHGVIDAKYDLVEIQNVLLDQENFILQNNKNFKVSSLAKKTLMNPRLSKFKRLYNEVIKPLQDYAYPHFKHDNEPINVRSTVRPVIPQDVNITAAASPMEQLYTDRFRLFFPDLNFGELKAVTSYIGSNSVKFTFDEYKADEFDKSGNKFPQKPIKKEFTIQLDPAQTMEITRLKILLQKNEILFHGREVIITNNIQPLKIPSKPTETQKKNQPHPNPPVTQPPIPQPINLSSAGSTAIPVSSTTVTAPTQAKIQPPIVTPPTIPTITTTPTTLTSPITPEGALSGNELLAKHYDSTDTSNPLGEIFYNYPDTELDFRQYPKVFIKFDATRTATIDNAINLKEVNDIIPQINAQLFDPKVNRLVINQITKNDYNRIRNFSDALEKLNSIKLADIEKIEDNQLFSEIFKTYPNAVISIVNQNIITIKLNSFKDVDFAQIQFKLSDCNPNLNQLIEDYNKCFTTSDIKIIKNNRQQYFKQLKFSGIDNINQEDSEFLKELYNYDKNQELITQQFKSQIGKSALESFKDSFIDFQKRFASSDQYSAFFKKIIDKSKNDSFKSDIIFERHNIKYNFNPFKEYGEEGAKEVREYLIAVISDPMLTSDDYIDLNSFDIESSSTRLKNSNEIKDIMENNNFFNNEDFKNLIKKLTFGVESPSHIILSPNNELILYNVLQKEVNRVEISNSEIKSLNEILNWFKQNDNFQLQLARPALNPNHLDIFLSKSNVLYPVLLTPVKYIMVEQEDESWKPGKASTKEVFTPPPLITIKIV